MATRSFRRCASAFSLRSAKILAPAAVLALGLFVRPTPSAARPDYTRRTKQECAYCHLPGGWFLTDAGKFFEQHRTLNGYKPPDDASKQPSAQKAAPNKSAQK